MTRAIKIRFSGLAALGTSNRENLERRTGYHLEQEGNDWVVYDDDPALLPKAKSALTLHPSLGLHESEYVATAKACMKTLDPQFEAQGRRGFPADVIASNLGDYSKIESANKHYFWTEEQNLEGVMVQEVFPNLVELGARHVHPVSLDTNVYYPAISLAKISYLNRMHGIDAAREMIIQDRVLDAALPGVAEPINYLDALLFVPPFALALPLFRLGSGLLFTPQRMWQFPQQMTGNIFGQLDSTTEQFGTGYRTLLFTKAETSVKGNRWILELAVASINNLTSYFSSPLKFVNPQGVFDELKMLKATSLLHLMIADAKAINLTDSHHAKSRFTFQFLDKLANLIVELTSSGLTSRERGSLESDLAGYFCMPEVFDELKKIIGYHARLKHPDFGRTMIKCISRLQVSIEADIKEVFAKGGVKLDQESRTRYFRTLRNIGHGTFLTRDQFENLFLRLNPIISTEFTYLPWMIVFAFGLAPERIVDLGRAYIAQRPKKQGGGG